jgi:uncharacterized protein YaiI (UPF0178 family)
MKTTMKKDTEKRKMKTKMKKETKKTKMNTKMKKETKKTNEKRKGFEKKLLLTISKVNFEGKGGKIAKTKKKPKKNEKQ